MSEPLNQDPEPRALLRMGDEDETIEQHTGSDTGSTSQPDDGTPPPP